MSNNLKNIKTAYRSNTSVREHDGRLNQKQYNNYNPKPNATYTLLDDLKSNASVVRRKLVSRMVFCVLLGLIVPVHIYRTSVSYA